MRFVSRVSLLGLLLCSSSGFCDSFSFSINTGIVSGSAGQLIFDFINGGQPSNSVTISHVTLTGGAIGTPAFTGAASGNVSMFTLSDSSFFNEAAFTVTTGTSITFSVDASENSPGLTSLPDSLSVFLLDALGNSLLTSVDPTGANALFQLDAGSTGPTLYSSSVSVSTSPVPEPSSLALLITGCVSALTLRFRLALGCKYERLRF